MPEGYLHLTCDQRCQIYALLQSGHSQAHIARQIGVSRSTVSRELDRNAGARGYRSKQAHEKASQRRQEASDQPRKMTPDVVKLWAAAEPPETMSALTATPIKSCLFCICSFPSMRQLPRLRRGPEWMAQPIALDVTSTREALLSEHLSLSLRIPRFSISFFS
jgi:predicted transcriptional regulator